MALGLNQSQIDGIEKQQLADPIDCYSDVYRRWQQLSTPQKPVSWTTLMTVLRSRTVGEDHLANFIQQTFVGNNEYNLSACQLMIAHTLLCSQQNS